MRIMIFSQYYAPEITAARARVQAFAEGLSARGHEVMVICEVPNHPAGVVRAEFRRRLLVQRRANGVSVRYLWVYASPEKTSLRRLAFYGSYAAMATVVGSAMPRPDVILVSSPPLPAAAAAALVAGRHRVPWIFDVRDVWPEAAVILGELSDPRLIRAAERLEQRLYRSASAIVTVTESFREHITRAGGDGEKISLISNGTTRQWLEAGQSAAARRRRDGQPFVWTYAGNIGIAQGMEVAVEAADRLGPGFLLRIVGGGPMSDKIEALAARLGGRVEFFGVVEAERARELMLESDALLVPLAGQQALSQFVPSKLFDCAAVGRPVVVTAPPGEATRLTETSGAGLAIAAGDVDGLAEALRRLEANPELAEGMGRRGLEFAAQNLREDGVLSLERLMVDLVRDSAG